MTDSSYTAAHPAGDYLTAGHRREVARRRDAQLAGIITGTLGRVCPFPATVLVLPDYDLLRVRAGRTTLLEVPRDRFVDEALGDNPEAAAYLVGTLAAEAYLAAGITPEPHIELGQD